MTWVAHLCHQTQLAAWFCVTLFLFPWLLALQRHIDPFGYPVSSLRLSSFNYRPSSDSDPNMTLPSILSDSLLVRLQSVEEDTGHSELASFSRKIKNPFTSVSGLGGNTLPGLFLLPPPLIWARELGLSTKAAFMVTTGFSVSSSPEKVSTGLWVNQSTDV